jgi:hypothetical protein
MVSSRLLLAGGVAETELGVALLELGEGGDLAAAGGSRLGRRRRGRPRGSAGGVGSDRRGCRGGGRCRDPFRARPRAAGGRRLPCRRRRGVGVRPCRGDAGVRQVSGVDVVRRRRRTDAERKDRQEAGGAEAEEVHRGGRRVVHRGPWSMGWTVHQRKAFGQRCRCRVRISGSSDEGWRRWRAGFGDGVSGRHRGGCGRGGRRWRRPSGTWNQSL